MELWEKLRALRKSKGVTQSELAEALPGRITRTSIGLWETENAEVRTEPRKANREALADYYGISVDELMSSGRLATNVAETQGRYGVGMRRVPIVDIVQAGSPSEYTDMGMGNEHNEWVPVIDDIGDESFALRVDGNSMTQESREPSYPHGSIIVCDPSLAGDVKIGDDVIVRLLDDDTRVFKSFDMVDGNPVLVPLNKQYPVIYREFEVLAVVVQMIVKRR